MVKKLSKPENYPKKPPTAYIAFSKDKRKELNMKSGSLEEQGKILGELWKNLDSETKEKYNKKYKEEMVLFNEKMEEYKKTDEYKKYKEDLKKEKKVVGKKSRGINAYNVFLAEQISNLKNENKKVAIGSVVKESAKKWAEMSDNDKEVYRSKAKERNVQKEAVEN